MPVFQILHQLLNLRLKVSDGIMKLLPEDMPQMKPGILSTIYKETIQLSVFVILQPTFSHVLTSMVIVSRLLVVLTICVIATVGPVIQQIRTGLQFLKERKLQTKVTTLLAPNTLRQAPQLKQHITIHIHHISHLLVRKMRMEYTRVPENQMKRILVISFLVLT